MTINKKLSVIFKYALVVSISLMAIFPFYWLVNTSLQTTSSLFEMPPHMLPASSLIGSYLEYIQSSNILLWLKNSLIISLTSTVVSTIIAVPCSYSISRFNFRGRSFITFLVLFTQMLPGVLLIIPVYIIYSRIGLVNSMQSLILLEICFTVPIGVWFLKGFFDSIPRELEESSTIDGCSSLRTLLLILLPLLVPGIIATATWSFIIAWDEYLFAYTMIEDARLWTVTLGLSSYIGQYNTPWSKIMSGAVLATLPVVLMFMFFQRYLVSGLTAGSVKG